MARLLQTAQATLHNGSLHLRTCQAIDPTLLNMCSNQPMAILNILEFPDPRLRTIAKPVAVVDDEVRQLVDDMFETMYEAPGIGLAATQVNVHKRIVVMDLSEDRTEPRVFINPEFESLTDEMDQYQEGCLSVPGFYENVDRPQKVKIKALDRDGQALRTDRRRPARGVHSARMRPPQRQIVRRLPVHAQTRPDQEETGKAPPPERLMPLLQRLAAASLFLFMRRLP